MDHHHHHHYPQHHPLPQQEQDQQVDLEVVGRHALLFDDDATSEFVNSSDALVPWSGGDPSLLIDRYDARHLLPRLPPPRALRRQQQHQEHVDNQLEADGVSRAELDLERYKDLETGGSGGDQENEEGKGGREVAESGAYHTVSFSYDSLGAMKVHDDGLKTFGYHPLFPVPDCLLSNLPPTEKVHQIISRTAKFVSEHGGQSEIILRVKQGGNPTFGFLMPDHELHAYFRFLVDHPELSKVVTDSADKQEGKMESSCANNEMHIAGGALSLLGSIYGSGEDDGVQDTLESKETQVENAEDVTALSHRSQVPSSSEEARTGRKLPIAASGKPLPAKKGRSSTTVTTGAAQHKTKEISASSVNSFVSKPEAKTSDPGALILEPPSSLKRMMDKTVEFILRNGKEFEASLTEHDKTNEKFPFLRPSNQYHSYYLKVLQDAHESKLPRKNLFDSRNISVGHPSSTSEIRGTISDGSLSDAWNMMSQSEGSFQLDRKEKFRMVIGGAKKDTNNSSSKPAKPAGLSAEEAAAIVMGATRGLSNKTTSGAPMSSVADRDPVTNVTDGRRSSSVGSFSSLPGYKSVSKTLSDGMVASFLRDNFSEGTVKPGEESCNTSGVVSVANVIGKTVAGEADSSDACRTKEQKLKAERLKRAKMFAALIKGGKHKTSGPFPAADAHGGSQVAAASSVLSSRKSDLAGGEREGTSVPVDAEISDSGKKSHEKASIHDSRRECSQEKDTYISTHCAEESEGEHKHSRKRHRSRHSSHSNRDDHKHKHRSHRHRHHDSSEDEYLHSSRDEKKRRHHSSSKHKHHNSDEDEHLNKKRSESRYHYECRPSDDDARGRRGSHRHHKRSRAEENPNCDNKGDSSASNLSKQISQNLSNGIQEVAQPLVSEAQSSATEVPDDLRAKIRAMLLETM